MLVRGWVVVAALYVAGVPAAFGASSVERIRNDKVVVMEDTLAPGEQAMPARLPSMVVYMSDGTLEVTPAEGRARREEVKTGETVFVEAGAATVKNAGDAPLHFARVEFLGPGFAETWGMTGLSPNYKMLVENRYARAYDIKIPAQTFEPQHTHHDRVVVSLSGAELEHILPDGTKQPSTLKTGEVVWRLGATHIGHNLGHTDLWVIAIEPK
jgi:quercetin dioxygenase-like cupin family protein